jgi:hypothetical protein
MLKRLRFEKSLQVLEFALQKALRTEDVQFETGEPMVSLLDFPRFSGASWAHNDLLLFVPTQNIAVVIKLSDKRFIPLHERLSSITMGLDPFIGTTFTINQAQLNSVFHRIRFNSKTSIDENSFRQIKSFPDLIEACKGTFRSSTYISTALLGSIPLDLSRCVIARYENYYALMEFFQCKTRIKSVTRNKDWTYNFVFDFEGVLCKGSMLRDSLFDNSIEPERIAKNSRINLLGFITYGRTSLQAFGTRIHVLALQPTTSIYSTTYAPENVQSDLPTINYVENELIQLELRKERKFYLNKKWFNSPSRTLNETAFSKVNDPLVIGDIARLLSSQNVSIHDLFEWDNGGKPLLLMWSRGGRRASNEVEELRSALKFILGTRYEINLPKQFFNEEGGKSNDERARI